MSAPTNSPYPLKRTHVKNKAPNPRRDAREAAVQFLYGNESLGTLTVSPELFEAFWAIRTAKSHVRELAETFVKGVVAHLEEIDTLLAQHVENYSLKRVSAIDRNILRLGAYEILFSDHIPRNAAINEAIEIAKRFGTNESPSFVNGILDKIGKS